MAQPIPKSKYEVTFIPKWEKFHASETVISHCEADVRCQIRVKHGMVKFVEIIKCKEVA